MPLPFSARFTGANYLTAANYTGNPAAFSVSHWVYPRVSQASRVFFLNYLAAGSKGWGTGIDDSASNKVKFYLGSNTLTGATVLPSLAWTHVVCTYDGTVARIYLNGSTTPDATLTSSVVYGVVTANNVIGALDGSSQFFDGRMAGVGYWSKALTTTEITALYGAGNGLAYADLSGTLLTSLGSYHDFSGRADLGHDSSPAARNYTNTGTVARTYGPAEAPPAYPARPPMPRVDPGNPLARKLLVAAPMGGGGGVPVNVVDGQPCSVLSAYSWVPGRYGRELAPAVTSGTSPTMRWDHGAYNQRDFTLEVWATVVAYSTAGTPITAFWTDDVPQVAGNLTLRLGGGTSAFDAFNVGDNTTAARTGVPMQMVVVGGPSAILFYLDGDLVQTIAPTVASNTSYSYSYLNRDDALRFGNLLFHQYNLWGRQLSEAEVRARFADPWGLYDAAGAPVAAVVPPPQSHAALAATAADATLAASLHSAAPAPSIALGATAASATLAAALHATAPAGSAIGLVATAASATLAASIHATTSVPAGGQASLIIAATGSATRLLAASRGAGSVVVLLHCGGDVVRRFLVGGSCRIVFRARGRLKVPETVFDDNYLGRFQVGRELPLEALVRDRHGTPTAPTAAPVASIYDLATGTHVADVAVPRLRGARSPAVFAGPLRLGTGFAPGRYAVVYRSLSGGFTGLDLAVFEVEAGGDAAGPVVAAQSVAPAAADSVLVQLGAGILAAGRKPRPGGP